MLVTYAYPKKDLLCDRALVRDMFISNVWQDGSCSRLERGELFFRCCVYPTDVAMDTSPKAFHRADRCYETSTGKNGRVDSVVNNSPTGGAASPPPSSSGSNPSSP